jgi:hypothetical protein
MRFISEFGYTVKLDQNEAHQRWLMEHDAAIRASSPPGTRYIGTFAVVMSTEKQAGSYKALFELDSYGALDATAAATKDPNNEYGRLVREVGQFIDNDLAAPWSNTLLKDVLDATVWDPQQG